MNSTAITREAVLAARRREPRRLQFSAECSGLRDGPDGQARFAVPFYETVGPLFQSATGSKLLPDAQRAEWSCPVPGEAQRKRIREWEAALGTTVFLRDCLSLSIALDYSVFEREQRGRTQTGQQLFQAKYQQHAESVGALAQQVCEAMRRLPYYLQAQAIATVPPQSFKTFDLPLVIAEQVGAQLGMPIVTSGFTRRRVHQRIKRIALEDKWNELDGAQIAFQGNGVRGRTVILIDDIYQSGTTLQYMAMVLKGAGARRVLGLAMVKTWADTDNTQWSGPH
jgi:predicted amidophosphoribosyltransferase